MKKKVVSQNSMLHIISACALFIASLALTACGKQESDGHTVTSTDLSTSSSSPASSDRAKTIAGNLVVNEVKDKTGLITKTLSLANKVIYDQGDMIISIERTFDFSGKTVVLVQTSTGGNACPANYLFLTVQKTGEVSFTDEFGTCSDLPRIGVSQEEITITLPDMQGRGDEAWKYSRDGLAKIKHLDMAAARNAPRLSFKEDTSISIRGTLERSDNGKDWFLVLPQTMLLDGGDGSFCHNLVDSIPISVSARRPHVNGEAEFEVVIRCPHAGAYISDITESVSDKAKGIAPAQGTGHQPPVPVPVPVPPGSSGDRVTAYANNLADQVAQGNHPACLAFASNLRMVGKSGAPDYVRVRQLDTMFDRVPGMCLQ